MPRYTSGENTTDPLTGIPVILGQVRTTQNNRIRVLQTTGEPPYGRNQHPGVPDNIVEQVEAVIRVTQVDQTRITSTGDRRVVSLSAASLVGLPYGFTVIPVTGPLS